jgi:hypothetical protein
MSKKGEKANERDAAGIGPHARERAGLVPLSEMKGWNVVDGGADIRSWEVRTLAGRILGHVRDMLIDRKAGEVVMLDVDLAGSDKRAMLPLRLAEVDRTRRVVRADSGDLQAYEASTGARLTTEELGRVRPQRQAKPVRHAAERVVERRPVVEETIVRRRPADDSETRL